MVHLVTGYAGYEHIQSEDDGSFNASFFGGGQYVMESGNKFSASIIDNNTIRILDGDGLMYGRHFRVKPNNYEDITIQTGTAGTNRIDLICAVYRKNQENGTETVAFEVVKGTAASSPKVPSYTNGNILNGATLNYMPLYKVTIEGVVLKKIEKMFTIIPTYKTLAEEYAQQFQATVDGYGNSKMDKANGTAAEPTLSWTMGDGGTVELKRDGTSTDYSLYLCMKKGDGTSQNIPIVSSNGATGQIFALATRQQGIKADNAMPQVDGTADNPTLRWQLSDGGTVAIKRTGDNGEYLNIVHYDSTGKATDYYNIISSTTTGHRFELATRQQGEKADAAMPKTGGKFTGAVEFAADPTASMQAATKQYVDKKTLNRTILWTNASPTSDFATQLVEISNINSYPLVAVKFYTSTTIQQNYATTVLPIGGRHTISHLDENGTFISQRTFARMTTGVQFNNATKPNTTANDCLIPFEIVAYK